MTNEKIKAIAQGLLEKDVAHDDMRELIDTWNGSEELRTTLLSSGVPDEENSAFQFGYAACCECGTFRVACGRRRSDKGYEKGLGYAENGSGAVP